MVSYLLLMNYSVKYGTVKSLSCISHTFGYHNYAIDIFFHIKTRYSRAGMIAQRVR